MASVLHDLPLALQADRVVLLRAGRVAATGAHDDPALHAALCEVFEHAIHIQRVGATSRCRTCPETGSVL